MSCENRAGKKRKSVDNAENSPTKVSKMSKNQSKTPVMILQEICAKKNPKDLPVYTEETETPNEYSNQNMRFFIRCQALNRESVGGGVTKKIAKHTAAEKLLQKCFGNKTGDDDDDEMHSRQTLDTNSVSDLLDYCVQKNFQKPMFTCTSSCGPSHAPSFTFECQLNSVRRSATAGNKQLAKQLSAKAVLEIVRTTYPDIEKKVAVVNPAQADEIIRQKLSTYLDAKKQNKVDKMGTSIKDRHKFYRSQDREFVDCLKDILSSTEDDDRQKFQKLLDELETMWPYCITKLADTDLMKFELEIEFEKFTSVLIAPEAELYLDVLQYFKEMLNITNVEAMETENTADDAFIFQAY